MTCSGGESDYTITHRYFYYVGLPGNPGGHAQPAEDQKTTLPFLPPALLAGKHCTAHWELGAGLLISSFLLDIGPAAHLPSPAIVGHVHGLIFYLKLASAAG